MGGSSRLFPVSLQPTFHQTHCLQRSVDHSVYHKMHYSLCTQMQCTNFTSRVKIKYVVFTHELHSFHITNNHQVSMYIVRSTYFKLYISIFLGGG